jgi:hypothetical protein
MNRNYLALASTAAHVAAKILHCWAVGDGSRPPAFGPEAIYYPNMKTFTRLLVFLLLCAAPAAAQEPRVAGTGPVISVSLGYSYFNLGLQPKRASLNGADSTFAVDFHPRFGVTLDVGYVRGSNVNGSTHHGDVLSYLAGPVFYIARKKGLTTFVHVLAGGARIAGAIPDTHGFVRGYTNELAIAFGGGIEHQFSRRFAIRATADYVRASYLTSPNTFNPQNDVRVVTGLLYYFGTNRR